MENKLNTYMKQLMERAKGKRTISDYSKDSDISYAYVSRIMNGNFDSIPSDKLCDKIIMSADPPFSNDDLSDIYDTIKEFRIENLKQKLEEKYNNVVSQSETFEEDYSDGTELEVDSAEY